MAAKKKSNGKKKAQGSRDKVKTPRFVAAFPHVFSRSQFDENSRNVFSVTALFDKSEDLSALKKLAKEAIEKKWPNKETRPKKLHSPFRDGDTDFEKVHAGYEGSIVIRMASDRPVGKVDLTSGGRILGEGDEEKIYPGCECIAVVTAYAYDNKSRGVSFNLESLAKVAEGDRLDFVPSNPEDDFADEIAEAGGMGEAEEAKEVDDLDNEDEDGDDDDGFGL